MTGFTHRSGGGRIPIPNTMATPFSALLPVREMALFPSLLTLLLNQLVPLFISVLWLFVICFQGVILSVYMVMPLNLIAFFNLVLDKLPSVISSSFFCSFWNLGFTETDHYLCITVVLDIKERVL